MNYKRLALAIGFSLITLWLVVMAVVLQLYSGVGNDKGSKTSPDIIAVIIFVLALLSGYQVYKNLKSIKIP